MTQNARYFVLTGKVQGVMCRQTLMRAAQQLQCVNFTGDRAPLASINTCFLRIPAWHRAAARYYCADAIN